MKLLYDSLVDNRPPCRRPPATQNTASYLSQCIGATVDTAAPWGAADEASLIKAPSAENPSSLVTWRQNPAEHDWYRASFMFPFVQIFHSKYHYRRG